MISLITFLCSQCTPRTVRLTSSIEQLQFNGITLAVSLHLLSATYSVSQDKLAINPLVSSKLDTTKTSLQASTKLKGGFIELRLVELSVSSAIQVNSAEDWSFLSIQSSALSTLKPPLVQGFIAVLVLTDRRFRRRSFRTPPAISYSLLLLP